MKSQLKNLISLQKIDTALMELEKLKGDLPKNIEALRSRMDELDSAISANKERLKQVEVGIRRAQGDKTDQKEKLDRLQEQLYLVKTNREYDALTMEIDHLKSEKDQFELKELELSEELDRLEEQLKLDDLNRETMASELESRTVELEKATASTEKEWNELMIQRDKLTPEIDPRYLSAYNRVRGARDGLAVVPITNQTCGGCFSRLTSQSVSEIRSGNTIAQCPACRRILYWPASPP